MMGICEFFRGNEDWQETGDTRWKTVEEYPSGWRRQVLQEEIVDIQSEDAPRKWRTRFNPNVSGVNPITERKVPPAGEE